VNSDQPGKLQKKRSIFIFFSLLLIVSSGFYLRCESVFKTEVIKPLRADASQYFMYAYNLRHKFTYSHQVGKPGDLDSPVKPDAVRSPGYPLFLALFVDGLPNRTMFSWILFSQAIISTLTILFTFLLFEKFLSPLWSSGIALLVALSPHLIVSNSYILTETLFCFLLVAFGFLFCLFAKKPSLWLGLGIGATMGIAALVRPSLQFFPFILALFLMFHYGWKRGRRYSGVILISFAMAFLPWIGRNMATLGIPTDNRLMINFLHHGIYPDFMYKGIPQSHGFPYRYDPRAKEIAEDPPSVLKEISNRFSRAPSRHAKWYLLDKPMVFWSWNIIQGYGDAFVYPVSSSPYFHNTFFRITHRLMFILHYPFVVLALFGCLMVWFPLTKLGLTQGSLLVARFCSLLLIYFTVIHVVGAPFPRYSVPLRPYLYGMALFMPYILIRAIRKNRVPIPVFEQQNEEIFKIHTKYNRDLRYQHIVLLSKSL